MSENKKIYTIQNELGDGGFIQYLEIVDGKIIEVDEVMGWKDEFNDEYIECFNVISVGTYDIIKNIHEMFNQTGNEHFLNAVNNFIDGVLSEYKDNKLTKEMLK